jgi:hypothetical protein
MEKLVTDKTFKLSAAETQRANELKKLNDALAKPRDSTSKLEPPESK